MTGLRPSILIVLVFTGLLAWTSQARAQSLFASEEFEYGSTANLQFANGGVGWGGAWNKLSDIPTGVTAQSLTWPHLITRGGSAYTAPYPSTTFTRYSRLLASYSDPDDTVYISCLIRPNVGYGVTAGLSFGTMWDDTSMVMGLCPRGLYGLMTPPDTMHSDTAVAAAQDVTTLLVARVHKNAGPPVTLSWSLYVNPVVVNAEPAQPHATLTIPATALPPAVFIYNDGGFSTDEIRFGPTWSSVLPVTPPGDTNGDGLVNVIDLLAVINAWGPCSPPPASCPADVDQDGAVNVVDLLMVINNWS